MDDLVTWVTFIASAIVVVTAGTQLARHGERIAEETGIGALWIGVVLIASATSLPEVVTDVSAGLIDEPNLAVGDLVGSSMANMMVLAILALLYPRRRIWQAVSRGHILVAALAVFLTSLVGASITAKLSWSIGHVGLDTIAIALLYALGTRVVFYHEYLEARRRIAEGVARRAHDRDDGGEAKLRFPSRRSLIPFAIPAALILAAAPFLASSAADISDITGINDSFVGVSFLALTTSLPELATGLAAVRLGAFDLAVGNLFGSNAFNMFALLFVDIAYRPGPISGDLGDAQLIAAFAAVVLMATGMMAIIYRAERRFFLIEPDAAAMLLAYIGGMWLVYHVGAR